MRSRYITTAAQPGGWPTLNLPEFAFVGRSNVGKSALLNALVGAKIARTSGMPGRTQAINFFEVQSSRSHYALADLPGYGFAKAPKAIQAQWAELIEQYLEKRETLARILFLFDVRRDVRDDDRELLAWLSERGAARTMVVVTKIDKLNKAARKPALARLATELELPRERVLGTSASDGLGIDALREALDAVLMRRDASAQRPN